MNHDTYGPLDDEWYIAQENETRQRIFTDQLAVDHPKMGEVLKSAQAMLKAYGIPLSDLPRFEVVQDDPENANGTQTAAATVLKTHVIRLYAKSECWNDPVQNGLYNGPGGQGFLSTDRPEHNILHEVGHTLRRQPKGEVLRDAFETVAARVSEYAKRSTDEFIAEVFSARVCGRTFDAEVMAMYEALGGQHYMPVPKRRAEPVMLVKYAPTQESLGNTENPAQPISITLVIPPEAIKVNVVLPDRRPPPNKTIVFNRDRDGDIKSAEIRSE